MYVLKGISSDGKPQGSSEGELEWIQFDHIHQIPLVEDLPKILPKVINHNRGEDTFFAHYYYNKKGELVVEFND